MTKIKNPQLFKKIKEFLTEYLPIVRKKSPNTITSYKISINLYLYWLQESKNSPLSKITIEMFNCKNIQDFMEWLKHTRGNTAPTINLRMIHVRQFSKFLMKANLISYSDYMEMKEIAKEADLRKKVLTYLSIEDTQLILSRPNEHSKFGIRDKFYIALLYDSGCRNQEILDLTLKDLQLNIDGSADLHIIGKGNKYRVTPITVSVVELFKKYCNVYHPNFAKQDYIFYTKRNGVIAKTSPDNMARILQKYEELARLENSLFPHLYPHLFRHTRGMHLYMAGVPLPLVSEWLGHSQIETTQTFYTNATIEMKREAANKLETSGNSVFDEQTFKYADDDSIIRKLYGLE